MSDGTDAILEALGTPFYRDDEGCVLYCGDSLDLLPKLPANCIDSVVTDPPYGLAFMGKAWDRGVPGVGFWRPMLAAAKPGATLLSFGGTRTYHRMACAIEDAGWEIRDCIQWIYGSGFPKSLDVSKAIDKAAGVTGELGGPKSAAHAGWIDRGRMRGEEGHEGYQRPWMGDAAAVDRNAREYLPGTESGRAFKGYGTALKPANEPVCVAMKPLDGTFAKNAERWGVAGLNIDGGRIGTDGGTKRSHQAAYAESGWRTGHDVEPLNAGRWPANVIHDGSEEVIGLFPVTVSGGYPPEGGQRSRVSTYGDPNTRGEQRFTGSEGSAARFFYAAKASRKERGAYNTHPTVKPLSLMEYLCRLTMTPTGGIVLDPFAGSGTTLLASRKLGRPCIGFEKDEAHCEIIARRLSEGRMQLA